jgi:prolyl-tRNA synthetase
MTHSDDDGLVLPPRLAPKHVVILPIYRGDEDRSKVREYCERVKQELEAREFAGEKIRVQLDDRDLRGGEKSWQHVKRGVPLRAEIGPRDLEKDSVFLARRDTGAKQGITRQKLVETVSDILTDMQNALFQRALRLREENTRKIENLDDFKAYFTPKNADEPEIHGGFAMCHWSEDPTVHELLKDLKVTIRCLPLDAAEESGRCIFTGKPSSRRAVFAKAY